MNKLFAMSVAVSLLSMSAMAKTIDGAYAKLNIGYGHAANYMIVHKDNVGTSGKARSRGQGFVGSVGMGYGFGNGFRPEVELLANDGVKGHKAVYNVKQHVKVQSTVLFFNGYYDFANNSKMTPFLLGGIGYGHTKTSLDNNYARKKISKQNVSLQAGLGASYDLTEKSRFELGYRFLMQGDRKVKLNTVNIPGTGPAELSLKKQSGGIHIGMVGVRMYL